VVVVAGLLVPATLFTQQKPLAAVAHLSSLTGNVTVKGPGSTEVVPAQVNMPIEEGSEVSTSAASSASVQVEGASTIQLSELSKASFRQEEAGQGGARQNVIILDLGEARFHLLPSKQDSYTVHIADATISPNGKVAFWAALNKGKMGLRVTEGSVVVSAHSGSLTVEKGRFLEYDPSAEPLAATSHARVVRLSYVNGTVTLKRPGSAEEEKALLNTPIQEGFELSTAGASYAEVEFENGSTARMGEHSEVLFHQLAADANGNKLNGMTFEQGYGTFNFVPERRPASERGRAIGLQSGDHDVYQVKLANATLNADGKCEFRTDLAEGSYRVEVFKGSVEVATNDHPMKLGEGKVLIQENGTTDLTADKITKDDWDQWTEARDRQAILVGKDESIHPVGSTYGWSDLNTYGEWITLPGDRFGWSPYAPVGWSPYSYGMWNLYPGMGWTWISADPWGWVTDHCGMWDFDPTFGWFWGMPMFGCGLWYPSLVEWYGGPGWYGWSPIRPTSPRHPPGRPHLPGPGPIAGRQARQIVRVPASVIQKGQMITAQVVTHVPAVGATKIAEPPAEVIPQTMAASNAATSMAGRPAPPGAHAGFGHASAPATVLMGGDATREGSLLAHHGLFGGREPLRSAHGTTLGGHYPVYGSAGEFLGSSSTGGGWHGHFGGAGGHGGGPVISSGRSGVSGVTVASHGTSGGGSSASGGGGSHSSGGGGGFSGGGSSVSASSGGHSGGVSGGASAGGGGGHH
jgi:ferric-dicitrate binding protein FerR (iron transport regulator)